MLSTFDPDKGPLFQGEFGNLAVIDPALPGHVGNLVLDPTKPYTIRMKWEISGTDVPLYLAALDPLAQAFLADAQGLGLRAVDLRPALAAASPGAFQPDDPHLSARGHGAVAAALAELIEHRQARLEDR